MDSPELSPTHDSLPRPRPFALKALACFIVSLLCLGWLVSLQLQSSQHSGMFAPAPKSEPPPEALNPNPAPDVPPSTPDEAAAQNPKRELAEADFMLAEIEVIRALVQTDGALDYKQAARALKVYTLSTNPAVREASTRELLHVFAAHDKAAMASLASAAGEAKALADKRDYAGAVEHLQKILKALPDDAAWTNEGPDKKLREMIADYEKQRAEARSAALNGLEAGLRNKDAAADARIELALAHPDPAVRAEAKAIQTRVNDDLDKAVNAQRAVERVAREEWVRFFKRFGGTLAEGDFSGAAELCEQPPFDSLLKGGVSDPDKVLKLCAADVAAVQNIYDEALKDARGIRKTVSFRLRHAGQAAGTLVGVNGRMLRINPGKGAEIGVKITELTAEGIKALLDSGARKKANVRFALVALEAYENYADAEQIVTAAYAKEREPLPLHWSERFKVEKSVERIHAAEGKLAGLKKAIESDNGDDVKAALEQAKAVAGELEKMGAMTGASRDLMAKAENVAAKKQLATVILQNGVLPAANWRGLNTDQISEYREAAHRTDIGVGYGLKLGASGGLQRVLIKIDGLDVAAGNARIRKASLELYQIDSPQYAGAVIGAFRLKKPWLPDSGSWLSYDGQKDHAWTIPGASGEADIEPREDAKVTLDKKHNQWRSFDVTQYVQDVLSGKTQNNGFLLKIVNGEPEFHARFYPETDLDRGQNKALRPRLILELARDVE